MATATAIPVLSAELIDAAPKVKWGDSKMQTTYANLINAAFTREVVSVFFGRNQTWEFGARKGFDTELTDRIVLTPESGVGTTRRRSRRGGASSLPDSSTCCSQPNLDATTPRAPHELAGCPASCSYPRTPVLLTVARTRCARQARCLTFGHDGLHLPCARRAGHSREPTPISPQSR
jgi:hypothetical protein